jgi:hypothetical protein
MKECMDMYLARSLALISYLPEPEQLEPVHQLAELDDEVADRALDRLEMIDAFTPGELEFFDQGDEDSRIALLEL